MFSSRQTVAYWLARHARLQPTKTAVKHEGRSITFDQLNRRVNRLANALSNHPVRPKDRIAVLMYNRLEVLEVFFACAKLGAVCVPLNFRLAAEELEQLVADAGASGLFYEEEFRANADRIREKLSSPNLLVSLEPGDAAPHSYEGLLSSASDTEPETLEDLDFNSPVLIMYTAGSTGVPKGVLLTQENIHWQCQNALMMGLLPNVTALAVLPFFHVGGLLASAVPVLMIGGTLVIQTSFSPEECLKLIADEGVSGMVGVPAMFQFMADDPSFKSIEFPAEAVFTSGGAPMPTALIDIYEKRGVTFRQGYGLTEATAGVTFMYPEDALHKPGSVGRPCFFTDVAVVDDKGRPLTAGEPGEVVVRGPNVMREYWGRPEATADALKDGWLHTGDVGRFDQDGYLYITDRKKDMIISGGENIFPAEIENILFEHPAVKECAVLGAPDARWGERVVAVVALHAGKSLTLEETRDFLSDRLARYKLPRQLEVVEQLPRSAAAKVLKNELRTQLGLSDALGGGK
jgi:fatty-acyl-CoA synthase